MSWLSVQTKGLGVTKTNIANAIGVSRPTLNKIEANPSLLNMSQIKTMQQLGFTIPGNDIIHDEAYVPIICGSCGGNGRVYKLRQDAKLEDTHGTK